MSGIAKHWPVIRQVVYGLLAAALAVAAAAGWITQDNADQWLAHVVTALGAVGFVVAGLFVDRTSPAQEQKIEQAVQVGVNEAISAKVGAGGNGGWPSGSGVGGATTFGTPIVQRAQSELERVRAEAERLLGR